MLSSTISPHLLVAECALAFALFAAGEEKVAAVRGFEWLGIAAGTLAFGAFVRSVHGKFSLIGSKPYKGYLKTNYSVTSG